MPEVMIRAARADDAEMVQSIYRPMVVETAISFELTPPDLDEMARRIETADESHAWLVAEADGRVAGYAYGTMYAGGTARYRMANLCNVFWQ